MKCKEKFELLRTKVNKLVEMVDELATKYGEKVNWEYLDSQEACEMLRLSPRNLQALRSAGRVGYSMVGNKVYYTKTELIKFLNNHKVCKRKKSKELKN